jgi:hypothetical protein
MPVRFGTIFPMRQISVRKYARPLAGQQTETGEQLYRAKCPHAIAILIDKGESCESSLSAGSPEVSV